MKLSDYKIKTRLGTGFGLVLLLMLIMIITAIGRFGAINQSTQGIVTRDWPSASAAATIDAAAREDARRVLALFVINEKGQRAKSYERIDQDKKVIDAALLTLGQLTETPEEKALLSKIEAARATYNTSFLKVADLVEADQREQAAELMNRETFPALDKLEELTGSMVEAQKRDIEAGGLSATGHIEFSRTMMIALGVAALIVSGALALWITASITGPLEAAVAIAKSVAAGDLSTRIAAGARDETGELLDALAHMNTSLARTVNEVRRSTATIGQASNEIATGNMDLSGRTESQASSLEETASTMEELTSTVKQNADNARQANQLVISASAVATRGGELVAQVVDTMGSIKASSSKIVDIIGVIDGIAFQTNILALNAAVEAARAGEQGRGFAVVASEVRGLAQRSAMAAKEIKVLIDDSVKKVDGGSAVVDEAGQTMGLIVTSVQQVADIMAEITAASQEQSQGIGHVNDAISQMDEMTQQNAALVEQAAAAAQSMQDEAATLSASVSVFRLNGAELVQPVLAAPPVQRAPAAPKTTLAPPAATKPAGKPATKSVPQTTTKPAAKPKVETGSEWEEF